MEEQQPQNVAPPPVNTYQAKLVGQGRLLRFPTRRRDQTTVLTINFDHLAARLKATLKKVYQTNYALKEAMPGVTFQMIDNEIGECIDHTVDLALLITYNRLRNVADKYSTATRNARMNRRAPHSSDFEFPTFLASLLSSIGPLFIEDGIEDMLVIYATETAKANNYGRTNAPAINLSRVSTFSDALTRAGVKMAKIDPRSVAQGSYFTTIIPTLNHSVWTFTGTQHSSHYEDIDVLRAWLTLHDDVNQRAVQYCGLVIERTTTSAITTAVANARPEGVAAAAAATDPADPIGIAFQSNLFGIDPAVAAAEGVTATPAATYIIGRGTRVYNSTVLGSRLVDEEMVQWAQSVLF